MERLFIFWIGIQIATVASLPVTVTAQERVTETIDGVTVTLPSDEADLAKPILNIAKVWKEAFGSGKFTTSFRNYLENPKAAENSKRHIAHFLGLEAGPDEAIERDWEEAYQQVEQCIEDWEAWETGFSTINFWSKAEAEQQARKVRNHLLFSDTRTQVRNDGAGFRIHPSIFPERIDPSHLPSPAQVKPMQLDFVLAYSPGTKPGVIARNYHELMNRAISDPKRGVVIRSAAELYEALFHSVIEKALARHIVTGEEGRFFRDSLGLGFRASLNDRINPDRGRKVLFGERIRQIANLEPQAPLEELTKRIRETAAWPAETDGEAEKATREIALAMVFMSMKNAGANLNGWLQSQEGPLTPEEFAQRLQVATGNESWEQIFQRYCQALATQFERVFVPPTDPDPTLSDLEKTWPRITSGRIEVVHPPGLEETAALCAAKIDVMLTGLHLGHLGDPSTKFAESDLATLKEYGLSADFLSLEEWQAVLTQIDELGLEKLQVRLWFSEDLKKALLEGASIPGISIDKEAGEVTINTNLQAQRALRIKGTDKAVDSVGDDAPPISYVIVPFPREEANILASEFEANVVTDRVRKPLEAFYRAAERGDKPEEQFFIQATMVAGAALLREVIASEDREWFTVGMSHWLAIRLTDARFGPGSGQRVFEKRWPAQKNDAYRGKIDLTQWKSPGEGEEQPLNPQHTFFATMAIEAALEGKDAAFVSRFLDEIRKTPRKRAHIGHVYGAYKKAGGGNLKAHAQKATREPEA